MAYTAELEEMMWNYIGKNQIQVYNIYRVQNESFPEHRNGVFFVDNEALSL